MLIASFYFFKNTTSLPKIFHFNCHFRSYFPLVWTVSKCAFIFEKINFTPTLMMSSFYSIPKKQLFQNVLSFSKIFTLTLMMLSFYSKNSVCLHFTHILHTTQVTTPFCKKIFEKGNFAKIYYLFTSE